MVPAQRCFAAADLVALRIDQRLVKQFELAVHKRLAQISFHISAHFYARIHLSREKAICATFYCFSSVQSHVRILDQLVCLSTVIRRNSYANACTHDDFMVTNYVGCRNRGKNAVCENCCISWLFYSGLNYSKFVTAKPDNRSILPHATA